MPKISIIVPIYKVEKYLSRCIDSILNQTFTDFECILVDDGSPDRCGEICDEYAKKDKRIKVIHKVNGGLSDARNAGIDIADGEYIAFVDSDDWIHPQMYEILYNGIMQNGVTISVCEYKEVHVKESFKKIDNFEFNIHEGMTFLTTNNVAAVIAVNKLYHKSLFKDIRYPVGKLHEDEFTTYKLLYAAGDIAYCDEQLYFYFINENGITKSEYTLKRLDAIEATEELYAFIKKRKFVELYSWFIGRLLNVYYFHYLQTGKSKEFSGIHHKLKWTMRKVLLFEPLKCHVSIKNYPFYCELAFPRIVNAYRKLKRLIHKKGEGCFY